MLLFVTVKFFNLKRSKSLAIVKNNKILFFFFNGKYKNSLYNLFHNNYSLMNGGATTPLKMNEE